MDWSSFPEIVIERIIEAAASDPADAIRLQCLERRTVTAISWEHVAVASLGLGLCAALRRSQDQVDWKLALNRAANAQLKAAIAPSLDSHLALRGGHAATLFEEGLLAMFGGRPVEVIGVDLDMPVQPAVLDVVEGRWLTVFEECEPDAAGDPLPPQARIRSTLTKRSSMEAVLIGGQARTSFNAPALDDVWRMALQTVDQPEGAVLWKWQRMGMTGDPFPARSCHTTVASPRGLLTFGGVGRIGHVLCCDVYILNDDIDCPSWHFPTQTGLLPLEGALHHACYHDGHLIIVGGVDNDGLQCRGLGRPSDIHTLDLASMVWARLGRQPLTPPVHSRAASWMLGRRLFIFGGDDGAHPQGSNHLAVLNLANMTWMNGSMSGDVPRAASHITNGSILVGGMRADGVTQQVWILPDLSAPTAQAQRTKRVPRWLKR